MRFGAQKTPPGRRVVKEIAHFTEVPATPPREQHRHRCELTRRYQHHYGGKLRVSRDTEAILGKASPLKPSEATRSRSSRLAILLVA